MYFDSLWNEPNMQRSEQNHDILKQWLGLYLMTANLYA